MKTILLTELGDRHRRPMRINPLNIVRFFPYSAAGTSPTPTQVTVMKLTGGGMIQVTESFEEVSRVVDEALEYVTEAMAGRRTVSLDEDAVGTP